MNTKNFRLLDLSDSDSEEVNRELFVRLFNHLRRRAPHVMVRPSVTNFLKDRMKRILKSKKFVSRPEAAYWKIILHGVGMRDDVDTEWRDCGHQLLEYFGYLDELIGAEGTARLPIGFATFTLADFTYDMFVHEEHNSGGFLVPTDLGERRFRVTGKLPLPKIPGLDISPRSLFTPEVLRAFSDDNDSQAGHPKVPLSGI